MKFIILIFSVFALSNSFSQAIPTPPVPIPVVPVVAPINLNSDENGLYRWTGIVQMESSNLNGTPLGDGQVYFSRAGQQFRVIASNDKIAIIKILDYTSKKRVSTNPISAGSVITDGNYKVSPSFYTYNYDESSGTKYDALPQSDRDARLYSGGQRYFTITRNELAKHAVAYHKIGMGLAFGLLNLPFKFRIQEDKIDFSSSFNIANAIGFTVPHQTWRKSKWTFIFSYGISSIQLDSISVNRGYDRLSSTSSFPTLTLATGPVYTYNNIQIGAFIGVDRLSRQNQDTFLWAYQGDPWLSIAFGYSIFSVENKSKKSNMKDMQQNNN